jgi:ABC-type antimicrobial peptide transport system permease subunit
MAEGGDHEKNLAGVASPVALERKPSRVPRNPTAFSPLLPILIVGLALVLAVLIIVAVGVLFGIVPYR